MIDNLAYLGSTIAFPIVIDAYGRPKLATGKQAVFQSCIEYLNIQIAETFFLRDLGCRIGEGLFEPNDPTNESAIHAFIRDTLTTWEKRVTFVDAVFSYPSVDSCVVKVFVRILNSNEVDSFIFPFYTNLKY